ncbi:MAG: DinB family protein [Taibaiella sp.]|nr:DinB family protein [Taibaiella sp.]
MKTTFNEIAKPIAGEYDPYARMYIDLLPDDNKVLYHLQQNGAALKQHIAAQPEEKLNKGYAPGKWTLKELLVHMIDTERIFAYRALCIARNEKAMLPGFEEGDYVHYSNAGKRAIEAIMAEYDSVRLGTLALLNSLDEEALLRTGNANNATVSVRALAYQTAGHELHHINVIKERYV